jgi:hypothetical protein
LDFGESGFEKEHAMVGLMLCQNNWTVGLLVLLQKLEALSTSMYNCAF